MKVGAGGGTKKEDEKVDCSQSLWESYSRTENIVENHTYTGKEIYELIFSCLYSRTQFHLDNRAEIFHVNTRKNMLDVNAYKAMYLSPFKVEVHLNLNGI